MSSTNPTQVNQIKEDVSIMETFIKSVLVSNQIIMLIVFIALWDLSRSASKQIDDGISEFQSPCIPAGTSGKIGWTRSVNGSINTCDLSDNSTSVLVQDLLNGMPSLDLSGNVQNATSIWVGIGITISLILMFAPYLLFIPKVVIRGILWIIARIKYQFIKNPNPTELTEEQAYQEQDKIVTEMRDNMWDTFTSKINNFIPTTCCAEPQKGGSTLEDFLESFAEAVGGNKGDCGGVIRFFIGLVQIIFLLIFSELNSGNSLKITTMLFSLFIALIVIFMLLGSLKPNPNFIFGSIFLGFVFIFIKFFMASKDVSTITDIISTVCLIISISLGIYSTTDPSDFEESISSSTEKGGTKNIHNNFETDKITENIGKIINAIGNADQKEFEKVFKKQEGGGPPEEPAESLGCLIYNYSSSIQASFGFGVAKIILIILGIIFLPNYNNNNSITKMMQESYGTPKQIFTGTVVLFLVLYTFLPWYSLYIASENANESKIKNIPFYTTACKFIALQVCGQNINNSTC